MTKRYPIISKLRVSIVVRLGPPLLYVELIVSFPVS